MNPDPEIFDYTDYRAYLRDYYARQKQVDAKFSHRYFAKQAKFKSPGFLKMVMEGRRNVSTQMAHAFAKAMKLDRKRAAYFETLVLYTQASDPVEKNERLDKLLLLRPGKTAQGLQGDQLKYYSSKKDYVIIREMVALPHFREDPKWIAQQLIPPIDPHEAREAIEVLSRLKLLKRDESGRLRHSDASLATSHDVDSPEVFEFQRAMINNARNALVLFSPDLRDISSMTVPLPLSKLEAVKGMLRDCQMQILRYINESDENSFDGVFQFNFQCFPVTKVRTPGAK